VIAILADTSALTSAFVIRLLYNLNMLTKQEALTSLNEISALRDWYGGVLETISQRYFEEH